MYVNSHAYIQTCTYIFFLKMPIKYSKIYCRILNNVSYAKEQSSCKFGGQMEGDGLANRAVNNRLIQ